jgi:hypothetical protein
MAWSQTSTPQAKSTMLRDLVRDFVRDEVEAAGMIARARSTSTCSGARVHWACSDDARGPVAPAAVIAHHELARSDPGSLAYLAHAILFVNNFYFAASEDSAARREGARRRQTEPGAAPTSSAQTRRAPRTYVLRGGRPSSPTARTPRSTSVPRSSSIALLGFSTGPHIDKMGMRAHRCRS